MWRRAKKILLGIACCLGLVLLVFLLTKVPGTVRYVMYEPEEGDLVFQSLPRVELVRIIEGVTQSSYSHVGLVVRNGGRWYVREAIFDVRDTPLWEWIMRGRGAGFEVYRLRPGERAAIPAMVRESAKYLGRPYDYRYRMEDDALYCSELVFKSYRDATAKEIGKLQKLGDLNWKPYEKLIEKYEGGPVPLERVLVSPVSLTQAPELERIY